jgi:hypothetical protein
MIGGLVIYSICIYFFSIDFDGARQIGFLACWLAGLMYVSDFTFPLLIKETKSNSPEVEKFRPCRAERIDFRR